MAVPEIMPECVAHPAEPNVQQESEENTDTRSNKERRRRERRERRARRQRRHSQLLNQMDNYMYEGTCYPGDGSQMPDILNSHIPPPAYATLPGPGQGHLYPPLPPPGASPTRGPPEQRGWRASIPGFGRRSRREAGDGNGPGHTFLVPPEESKSCCGVPVSQTVSIRWFIVMIAFVGICCAVVGTVLGAMKASGREHLTVSLLMIGVGIVLITVSGIAWRLTSQDAPSCRAMLGLAPYPESGDGRFLMRTPFNRNGHGQGGGHPYAGMMYSEFQYRPPPPSYQASMQEYRLRLLLMDRSGPPPPPPQALLSPPPAYHGPPLRGLSGGGQGSIVSRPPSYRSRASEHIIPLHARHPSQLSYLSFAGAPCSVSEQNELEAEHRAKENCVQHASVIPVVPGSQHKASIRIHGSDMEQYISNIQGQFTKLDSISCKSSKTGSKGKATGKKGQGKKKQRDEVTIVQNNTLNSSTSDTPLNHSPVVVTISGSLNQHPFNNLSAPIGGTQAEVDILAHL